jgi:hypothetical protein
MDNMAKKPQPAVTRLWFHINPQNTTNFIDLALATSAANRRFLRQGTTFAVAGMTLHSDTTVTGEFDVSKVPDTWMAHQAHKKSKMLWMKSQDQVLDDQPTIAARYRDFKVYLDSDMVGAPLQDASAARAVNGSIMLPVDRRDFTAKPGEWVYSALQLPVDGGAAPPLERTMHFVGPDSGTSVGMISGYGLSRSRPQLVEPNTPTTGGWMNDVFDVADNLDEIRLDVTDDNDIPPYRVGDAASNLEFYPGGVNNQPSSALHSVSFVSGTTVGGKTRVEGGTFNCGLIRFDWNLTDTSFDPTDPGSGSSMYLAVDLLPGMNKGYLAEAY